MELRGFPSLQPSHLYPRGLPPHYRLRKARLYLALPDVRLRDGFPRTLR